MVEDAGVAQARLLLALLQEQITEISGEIEAAQGDGPRSQPGGQVGRSREDPLRRQLYEAHRLIVALYRRFPEILDHSQVRTGRAVRRKAPAVHDELS
jgi:hypothetical protein